MRNKFLAFYGLVIVMFTNVCPAKKPTFCGLRDVIRDRYLDYPKCVSYDGSVVGGTCFTAPDTAAVWQNGFLKYLGGTQARSISDNGNVIVGISGSIAFKYENGVMTLLGCLTGGNLSISLDVSSDGNEIVGYSDSSFGKQAFRWKNNTMTGLGFLPGYTNESVAVAVSSDGNVILGYSKSSSGEYKAFRWENDIMTDLGILGYNVRVNSASTEALVFVGKSGSNAFRWKNGEMTFLSFPFESPYITSSEAYGVSNDGSIVVGAYYNSEKYQAFIWDEKNGMRNLEYVLTMDYGINVGAENLGLATAISDDGTTIVGYGNATYATWMVIINPCSAEMNEDLNNDCTVNFTDFALFSSHWLESGN